MARGVALAPTLGEEAARPAAWPARRLDSWDRMQLPRPFARVALVMGTPLAVPRDADATQMAAAHTAVVVALERDRAEAAAAVGAPPT